MYRGKKDIRYFSEVAKTPSANDLLKRIDSGTEISLATAFNIRLLISSWPVALLGLNELISISISGAVHEMLDNVFGYLF